MRGSKGGEAVVLKSVKRGGGVGYMMRRCAAKEYINVRRQGRSSVRTKKEWKMHHHHSSACEGVHHSRIQLE